MGIPGLENMVELEKPVYGVPAVYVMEHLKLLHNGIEAAFAKLPEMRDFYTSEWIIHTLLEKHMQLWMICGEDRIQGFALTQIVIYPKLKALEIFLLYGDFGDSMRLQIFKNLQIYARSYNCTRIVGYGRSGWTKALKSLEVKTNNRFILEVPHEDVTIH